MLSQVSQAVVGITTLGVTKNQLVEGLGTGVLIHQDGWILTNEHVAGNVSYLAAVFMDGRRVEGHTVWADKALDLAVVRLDMVDNQPYPVAELFTGPLTVGQPVYAIGTPLGMQFQHTVTQGIVSALDRTLQLPGDMGDSYMEQLIQTDASINPGNSGGPLIDQQGRVVGINTLKVVEAEGIGFAIPIAVAQPVLTHILRDGFYDTPYLGLYGYDNKLAAYLDAVPANVGQGVKVVQVDTNGPTAAFLQEGDIIVAANDTPVTTMLELRLQIYRCKVGDLLHLTIQRDSATFDCSITLTARPTLP